MALRIRWCVVCGRELEYNTTHIRFGGPRLASAPTTRRRIVLASLAGLLFVCAATGGTAWYASRCDRASYLKRASVSWINTNEEYLFACGQVWHSLDAGQTWAQIPVGGLPLLLRDGRIAMDRTPGRLYLAVLLAVPSNLQCLLCPFTRVQPVMFLSENGGRDWRVAQRLPEELAGSTSFRTLSADPDYADAAWAVQVTGEQVVYWATNDGGHRWRRTCEERLGFFCDPPSEFMAARHGKPTDNP